MLEVDDEGVDLLNSSGDEGVVVLGSGDDGVGLPSNGDREARVPLFLGGRQTYFPAFTAFQCSQLSSDRRSSVHIVPAF